MTIKIGCFCSCQVHSTHHFFLNSQIAEKNNLKIVFSEPFWEYSDKFNANPRILNYEIFNELNILIIENNNLTNNASSELIIKYCKDKNIKIIITCLLKFPIYPINWSGYGENINDYINFNGLENINYIDKFNKCLNSLYKDIQDTDLNVDIVDFIKDNFSKKLLFTHSLHPTNILLFELWKHIFKNLNINIYDYEYTFPPYEILFHSWINPFTNKMIKDLEINFSIKN